MTVGIVVTRHAVVQAKARHSTTFPWGTAEKTIRRVIKREVAAAEQGERRTPPQDRQPDEPPAFATLEPGHELETLRLLATVTDADNGTEQVVRSYTARLPLGAVVKVRESAAGKPAAYAVSALKDELRERGLL